MASRGAIKWVALLCAWATLTCCSARSDAPAPETALGDSAVTVASFDFPESDLLAQIYGQALRRRGYRVRFRLGLGPREFVVPALARGLVEFVPEYAGTALAFLSLGAAEQSSDVGETHAKLLRSLRGSNLAALAPAPAQDANAVVVTQETADRLDLNTVSDLKRSADQLVFGGPPECPSRPFCLRGLEKSYDLVFKEFLPLDAGGPLTRQALAASQIDVGLLFTTEPLLTKGLVALDDDLDLQPAENVTPLVHREVVTRWGPGLAAVVDRVSRRLTTGGLQGLNARMANGERADAVAATWLTVEGFR